ncbi:MAG: hypothetical protein H7843_08530 [Nitrospirota bacterium]
MKITVKIANALLEADMSRRIANIWHLTCDDIEVILSFLEEQGIHGPFSDDEISYLWILYHSRAKNIVNVNVDYDEQFYKQAKKALFKTSDIINEELRAANVNIQLRLKEL